MGKVVSGIGKALGLGGGGGPGPQLDKRAFDYRKQVEERVKPAREATLSLVEQLQKQSKGEGPSLATAQLKAAQDRNLSQLLAAAAAQRGGSAASRQRQVMRTQSDLGRQLAQDSAVARLQEQAQAQQLLGNVGLGQQAQDVSQIMQPGNLLAGYEQARFAQDVAKTNAIKAQQNAILGGLIQAGATAAFGPAGGLFAGKITGSSDLAGVGGMGGGGGTSGASMPRITMAEGGIVGSSADMARKAFAQALQQAVQDQSTAEEDMQSMLQETDSTANDIVPAKLSPGEMVVPKTVVSSGPDAIKSFAEAVMGATKQQNQATGGFGAIIQSQQELMKRLEKLESKQKK